MVAWLARDCPQVHSSESAGMNPTQYLARRDAKEFGKLARRLAGVIHGTPPSCASSAAGVPEPVSLPERF